MDSCRNSCWYHDWHFLSCWRYRPKKEICLIILKTISTLKKDMTNEFFPEAILIEHANIQDRLDSALLYGGKWKEIKPGFYCSIDKKIDNNNG